MRLHSAAVARLVLIVSVGCAAALSQQANPPSPQTTRPGAAAAQIDPKGLIEGRVVNAATGEPLKKVTLMLSATGSATPTAGETDENGHFIFKNLKPGRYMLIGERTGFARQAYGARSNPYSGTALMLSTDQEIKDLTFKVPPTAVIAGRVVDEDGDPIGNVMVMAMRPAYVRGKRQFSPAGFAQTNDLGEFRIANLKSGKYIISATLLNITAMISGGAGEKPVSDKPEMSYVTTYYPGVTDTAEASPIEVGMGTEVGGTNIQLLKGASFRVRGKVAESTQGQTMMATLTPKGASVTGLLMRRAAVVQQDGTFEIKGVLPGSYVLTANTSTSPLEAVGASVPVEVTDKSIDGLVLQATSSGADLPVTRAWKPTAAWTSRASVSHSVPPRQTPSWERTQARKTKSSRSRISLAAATKWRWATCLRTTM